jgi:hypothetical protein
MERFLKHNKEKEQDFGFNKRRGLFKMRVLSACFKIKISKSRKSHRE